MGELVVQRGRHNVLSYDDGIALEVSLLNPSRYSAAEQLMHAAITEAQPGRVVLVAGSVPVGWRAQLRDAKLSFVDTSGVADICWPRLRVAERHFGQQTRRRRSPLPLQKGHAAVAQELLIATAGDAEPALADLAMDASVSLSTASRAITQLAEHGLLAKHKAGRQVTVAVAHAGRTEIARRLADRTRWPGDKLTSGYLWGLNTWDTSARLSANARAAGVSLAVTGRAGAAFLGIPATSSPSQVHCWVDASGGSLPDIAGRLGLEPAPDDEANVVLSADPWGTGLRRSAVARFREWSAAIAHPVRVWCDLHSEPRGTEFAAQLWGEI
jgi:DNA-binding MarR family transcriptional regulator